MSDRFPPSVRIIPPALREQYQLEVGETWLCKWARPCEQTPYEDCFDKLGGGSAEIAIGKIQVCRICARELAEQILSCVELLEAAALSGWLEKEQK